MTGITIQKAAAQVSVNFQVFYNDLSPYGNWVDNPDYGYVWFPNVSAGFTPYGTNGYWIFTDAGWTWVSNYSWGWAPFHYGRWFFDAEYGPMWVPGYEWGPGWVTWRRSDGYYGWAPIGPGISIDLAYSSAYDIPDNHWRFVRDRDFGRTNMYNYYVNSSNYTTIIHKSVVINNTYDDRSNNTRYNKGPDRNEVEKNAGKKFNQVTLRERNKPGQQISKNELQLYRPRLERNNDAAQKATPARVIKKDMKPVNEKKVTPVRQVPQPSKKQTSDPRRNDQPVKQQKSQPQQPPQTQPQRNTKQPVKKQRNEQPVNQPASQPQHKSIPIKQRTPQQVPVQKSPQSKEKNKFPVKQKHDMTALLLFIQTANFSYPFNNK